MQLAQDNKWQCQDVTPGGGILATHRVTVLHSLPWYGVLFVFVCKVLFFFPSIFLAQRYDLSKLIFIALVQ